MSRDGIAANDGVHAGERLHDRLQIAVGDRTFRRVGQITNTHPETVRRYLGGHAPSVDFVSRLSESLGLNINWVLTGRGPMRQAQVKPHVLREANATDLLTHVALAIERLESRMDRLERYTQVLETMIRQGENAAAKPATSVEAKPPEGDHVSPASAEGRSDAARSRADSVADALAQRPRPDAR
ncbi:MAG: hypothetical protein RIE77_07280 [Phycisphaerales bacterium]